MALPCPYKRHDTLLTDHYRQFAHSTEQLCLRTYRRTHQDDYRVCLHCAFPILLHRTEAS